MAATDPTLYAPSLVALPTSSLCRRGRGSTRPAPQPWHPSIFRPHKPRMASTVHTRHLHGARADEVEGAWGGPLVDEVLARGCRRGARRELRDQRPQAAPGAGRLEQRCRTSLCRCMAMSARARLEGSAAAAGGTRWGRSEWRMRAASASPFHPREPGEQGERGRTGLPPLQQPCFSPPGLRLGRQ